MLAVGRSRPRRRGHRLDRRHGGAVRRHSARQGLDVDDDQRDGHHPAGALRRGRQTAGRVCRSSCPGTMQNDILKEYIARGTYIYPPQASLRIVTDIFAFCAREVPQWNTISISGYHIREAGSTAVQEVAFTFANAIAYVEAARRRRPRRQRIRPAPLVLLQRAQRLSRGGRQVPRRAPAVGAHHGGSLRRDQPARAAAALSHADGRQHADGAAARQQHRACRACRRWRRCMGGTQSLHTNGRDEALALPTEDAARIALRTQQIIALRVGRGQHDRSVRRLVSHRKAHQRDRRRRARAADAHRSRRRHTGGDRSRVHPAPDPGVGVQGAARRGLGRSGRCRRQQVPDRRAVDASRCSRSIPQLESAAGATGQGGASGARRGELARGSLDAVVGAASTVATTWCRRSSPRSKHTPLSAKLPTHSAQCLASTAK